MNLFDNYFTQRFTEKQKALRFLRNDYFSCFSVTFATQRSQRETKQVN